MHPVMPTKTCLFLNLAVGNILFFLLLVADNPLDLIDGANQILIHDFMIK